MRERAVALPDVIGPLSGNDLVGSGIHEFPGTAGMKVSKP